MALAGGLPLALPRLGAAITVDLLDSVQGLMVAGGRDVEPWRYGATPDAKLGPVDPRRDEFELDLVRRAVERRMPVIGVCRGIQSINVALGGTLVQDLSLVEAWRGHATDPGHRFWSGWELASQEGRPLPEYPKHPIRIEPGSLLHRALGSTEAVVDSFHHQAVAQVAPALCPTAWAPDGVIEALELQASDGWLLGLQCELHEEWRIERRFLRPFELFVEAAARYGEGQPRSRLRSRKPALAGLSASRRMK